MSNRITILVVLACLGGLLAGCPNLKGQWVGECDLGEVDGEEWIWTLQLEIEGDKGDTIRGYGWMGDNSIYELDFDHLSGERAHDEAQIDLVGRLVGYPVTMDIDGVIAGNLLTGECAFDWGEDYSLVGDVVLSR
jgi:hypothetical protein